MALKRIRSSQLKEVGAIAEVAAPTSDQIGDKYKVVRRTLWLRQDYKCCFCEFKEQHEYNDVEHYRPKAAVQRFEGGPVLPGYWWLAWTWANLMFACQSCNRSYKRTLFPLNPPSVPLRARQRPPGGEQPLLIDPFQEDPIDHIQFKQTKINKSRFWIPYPRDGSKKGFWTIRIAGLDRDTMRDLYHRHITNHVQREVEIIQSLMVSGDPTITAAWQRATGILLNPQQDFVGLSYDVLDAHFPEGVRREHGLVLDRPRGSIGR